MADMAQPKKVIMANGLILEDKLRIGGIMYLEDKYGCKIEQIDFQSGKVSLLADLMIALACQVDENGGLNAVIKKVKDIDITNIKQIAEDVKGLFDIALKNLETPGQEAERKDLTT